ncbi:hypothetical protein OAF63_04720 [Saprospiraceae bacterium]|nr:hypothetical protein [Saprospiraceae bacterium]
MKTDFLVSRISVYFAATILGCIMLLTPQDSFAQDRRAAPTTSKCVTGTLGHIDGNVILWNRVTRNNAAAVTDLCKCASKNLTKPKNCVDRRGTVIVNQGYEPEGSSAGAAKQSKNSTPSFQLLGGKQNCRLISLNEKVLMISGNSVKVGTECHCDKTPECDCKGQQDCGCDCSCKGKERWDFKAVNEEDPSKGFYIVTQERDPRAIMRNGDGVSLRHLSRMDGKMKVLSQWNFFINDRSIDGTSNYNLRPQDSYESILAVDSKKGTLTMVNHTFVIKSNPTTPTGDPASTAAADRSANPAANNAAKPFVMTKDWKCECVF